MHTVSTLHAVITPL